MGALFACFSRRRGEEAALSNELRSSWRMAEDGVRQPAAHRCIGVKLLMAFPDCAI